MEKKYYQMKLHSFLIGNTFYNWKD